MFWRVYANAYECIYDVCVRCNKYSAHAASCIPNQRIYRYSNSNASAARNDVSDLLNKSVSPSVPSEAGFLLQVYYHSPIIDMALLTLAL